MAIKHPGFFVWNPQRDMPSYRHTKMGDASTEAQRLAGANPGMDFFVMAPVAHARSEKSPVSFTPVEHGEADPVGVFDLDDEIPF